MSSISFRKPEFRLHLGYPDIILTSGNRTLGRVETMASGLRPALARLTEPVRRMRGRLVVVLPEDEVWRGRLDLAGRGRAEQRASARIIVAGRLGAAPGDIALVLGPRDPEGSFPVAGVRRSTLLETRALVAAVGLRPSSIVGAGLFPGFSTAPRLSGWSLPLPTLAPARRPLGAAIGAGAVVTLAVLVLGLPNPDSPRPAAAPTAQPVPAVAEAALLPADLPAVAEIVLPAPPPPLALASAERPKPRPATLASEPKVTVAARNMPPDLPLERPKPSPVQRLASLTAAPAKALDTIAAAPGKALDSITTPLRRPAALPSEPKPEPKVEEIARTAMPVLPAPAVATGLRPMHRPKAEAASPAPAPATGSAALAPRPRERSGSSQPAMLVASLEPAPLMQASIASATAAAVAAAVSEPPPPRPAALPARKPAPVAAKPAPVVVRPKPVAAAAPQRAPVKPLVTQAAPKRQVVVASVAPRQAVVAPAPVRQKLVAKPVPVKAVPVKRVKTVPAKTVPVRTAAKQVRQAAPKAVAAVAPVAAAKPVKQRPATHRVGLSRGNVSLVGVFAGADGRHALVRLPNGNIERVKAGDRVQGVQVAAINADSVRLTGRGKDTLLRLPD